MVESHLRASYIKYEMPTNVQFQDRNMNITKSYEKKERDREREGEKMDGSSLYAYQFYLVQVNTHTDFGDLMQQLDHKT